MAKAKKSPAKKPGAGKEYEALKRDPSIAKKKIAAAKKRAANYEPKVKSDLSFDELIAMSVGKPTEKKKQ